MMRIYRKVLSVILCAAVIAGVIPATVSIKAAAENSVKYLDANGVEQICGDASGASSSTVWSDGWYVADTASINNRITVNGVVNLILRDGCDFNANAGITVSRGNTLNIYAQSEGDGAGKLTATGQEYAAGIGGNEEYDYIPGGCVTINGGNIYANGGTYAAGIGGGFDSEFGGDGCTVTVNGGSVYATGGIKGAGIGGGCHISGGYAYRGGRGGSLTVNKGVITATAGAEASSIGGGSGGDAASVSLNAACIAIKETKDANVNLTLNDSPANAFQNLSSVYIVVKNEHYTDFDCYHTESVPATCTEFGKEKTICADCGMIFTTDNPEKAPLGHTPVLGQDGTYSCSTCGFTGVPYITYEYGITAKYKMCESFIEVTPETVDSVGTIWGNDNFYWLCTIS